MYLFAWLPLSPSLRICKLCVSVCESLSDSLPLLILSIPPPSLSPLFASSSSFYSSPSPLWITESIRYRFANTCVCTPSAFTVNRNRSLERLEAPQAGSIEPRRLIVSESLPARERRQFRRAIRHSSTTWKRISGWNRREEILRMSPASSIGSISDKNRESEERWWLP